MRAIRAMGLLGVLCGLLAGCHSEKTTTAPPAASPQVDAGTAVAPPPADDGSKTFVVTRQTSVSLRPEEEGGRIGQPLPVLSEIRVRVPLDGGWAALADGGGFVETAAISETRPSGARAEALAIDALSRGAMSEARTFASLSDSGSLNAALAMEQLPPEPVAVAPMGDGGTAEVGQVRYVAAVGSGLRASPEPNAVLSTPLAVNEPVHILELSKDWARAEVGATGAAADAGTPDAGASPVGVSEHAAATGWIPQAHLAEVPLQPEPLLSLAPEDPSAYAALRVATALTDDPKLWPRLVTSAAKAGRYTEAIRWANELAADEAVRSMTLNYVYGCRGNPLTATFVDEKTAEKGDLPKDACVYDLSVPPCVICTPRDVSYEEESRRQRETKRRAGIRKRFPQGPAAQASIPGGMKSTRLLFVYTVPITFKAVGCNDHEGEAFFERLVFSKPIAPPSAPRTEWLFSNAPEDFTGRHVLFGALLARNEADARRQLETWQVTDTQHPEGLVPGASAVVSMDDCEGCGGCGD